MRYHPYQLEKKGQSDLAIELDCVLEQTGGYVMLHEAWVTTQYLEEGCGLIIDPTRNSQVWLGSPMLVDKEWGYWSTENLQLSIYFSRKFHPAKVLTIRTKHLRVHSIGMRKTLSWREYWEYRQKEKLPCLGYEP